MSTPAVGIGHSACVDTHQRAMWERMIERIDDYKTGGSDLGRLLADLRGLWREFRHEMFTLH
jgi:hypothetical protein